MEVLMLAGWDWAWFSHIDFGWLPWMPSLLAVGLDSLTMVLDSSFVIRLVTIIPRLFNVNVLAFRACSLFWLVNNTSDN
jgi:hypothetical protein